MAKSGYRKSDDPNYSQENNKVNLDTNVTAFGKILYYLKVVSENQPLHYDDAQNKIFPAAKQAIGSESDPNQPDEHAVRVLTEFKLIESIEDDLRQFCVSAMGKRFLDTFTYEKVPDGNGKLLLVGQCSKHEQLMFFFDLMSGVQVVAPKYGRNIKPYVCLMRFLLDPQLGGFIRKNEWALFLNSSETLNDAQYDAFVAKIRDFRISCGTVGNMKKMERTLSRFVEPGVLVEAGGTGENTAYELSPDFAEIVKANFTPDFGSKEKMTLEQRFVNWAQTQDSVRTGEKITLAVAKHYAAELRDNLKDQEFSAVTVKNIFDVSDVQSFASLRDLILNTAGFSNYDESGYFSRALKLYGVFLEEEVKMNVKTDPYLAAIRTKPFVLLAGISGTGKSRLVRQLARGCCPKVKTEGGDHPLYDEGKPGNFEMIQVRPNWHDSTELMGYVSRIVKAGDPPKYVMTPFVEFLVKAWVYREVPFFLCLDEMNLAPVEQYFAEYLSVIETRKKRTLGPDGATFEAISTDPLVCWESLEKDTLKNAVKELFEDKEWAAKAEHGRVEEVEKLILHDKGIRIPPNLIVMGTVNMDETTCSFSRKVLDRAMSFELNDVADMYDPTKLAAETECEFGTIPATEAEPKLLTGKDAYDSTSGQAVAIDADGTKVGDAILKILELLNEKVVPAKKDDGSDDGGTMSLLAKTPFKIAYRTRNEIMIYCVERIGKGLVELPQALDEAISMKILSRIEGDSQHVQKKWLVTLSAAIESELSKLDGYDAAKCMLCKSKLADMAEQADYGYTSFWTR